MILYFSASGNSKYVAEYLAKQIKEETISLNQRIKTQDYSELNSDTPFILVCPIFAWRIPRIVEEYMKAVKFLGNKQLFVMVTTCGSSGNADGYAARLCDEIGMEYMGLHTFYMPGSYVAFMENPDILHAKEMNQIAMKETNELVPYIKSGQRFPAIKMNILKKFMSKVANPFFYKHIIGKEGFYATNKCVSCGKCVTVCPLNNIQLIKGKPAWGKECTHCMACIHQCPTSATEFKKISKGKNRFYNQIYY